MVLKISNPVKEGWTFTGWTFDGDTSIAKYGDETVSNSWSDQSTKVTSEYFMNLTTSDSSTVTLTAHWEKTEVATIYYYDDTTTTECTLYDSDTVCTYTVPEVVTSSTGPNEATYYGLSTSINSTTTTTTYNSINNTYYTVYEGTLNATYTKENDNVYSIGKTNDSCESYKYYDGTSYTASSCNVTLPDINPMSGYLIDGWYNSSNTNVGRPLASITLTTNETFSAKVNKEITSSDYSFDNTNSNTSCIDVTCALDELYDGLPTPTKLTDHITNLYNSVETKDVVTNNKISYNYATSVSLMNDRLGGVTESLDAGNIRYYGASPNNYIDIGDTEIDSNGNEVPTLYRIIGLFKDIKLTNGTIKNLVKVVRNESIGNYSWDTSIPSINEGYGINEWSEADLMKLLNPENEDNTGELCTYNSETRRGVCGGTTGLVNNSLWWNSGSGSCYNARDSRATTCDFTSTGLNSNVQGKIEEVVWNTGGHSSSVVYPNQIYGFERTVNVAIPGTPCSGDSCNDTVERTTSWEGKVALMYPSDYGYAVDFNDCKHTLWDHDSTVNNWIFNNSYQWLLTPSSYNARHAWNANTDGGVVHAGNVSDGDRNGVRPVFYLNSKLVIESGTGKINDPYVVR